MEGGSLCSAPSPGRHLRAEPPSRRPRAIHTAGEHSSLKVRMPALHLHNKNHWKTTSFSQAGRFPPSHEDGRGWDGPANPALCVSSVIWGRWDSSLSAEAVCFASRAQSHISVHRKIAERHLWTQCRSLVFLYGRVRHRSSLRLLRTQPMG